MRGCAKPSLGIISNSTHPTFPHDHRNPTQFAQSAHRPSVSTPVGIELVPPERGARHWVGRKLAARVTMPETTVRESPTLDSRRHNVGTPGQVAPMQPKAESQSMKNFPDSHFRASVTALDRGHDSTSSLHRNIAHRNNNASTPTAPPRAHFYELVTRMRLSWHDKICP